METTLCLRCGGAGEYFVAVDDQGRTELRSCEPCHGRGHSSLEKTAPSHPVINHQLIMQKVIEAFNQEKKS